MTAEGASRTEADKETIAPVCRACDELTLRGTSDGGAPRIVRTRAAKRRRMGWILFVSAHVLMVALIVLVLIPGKKTVPSPVPFLAAIALIECFYLFQFKRREKNRSAVSWIAVLVWAFMLVWELFTTKLNQLHPVLMPAPEAIFNVFATQYPELLLNVYSSLQLLGMGAVTALVAGVILGTVVGWIPALSNVLAPIARVLAPIPSVVFAPYLVALTPSFRSASALIIFLGIFWPTFIAAINRVASIDRRIIESARMLEMGSFSMVTKILLPYIMPSVLGGLNMQLTSSITMLTFAEMLGASSGMGYYIINYTNFANYTNVIAGIIVVGTVVTLLNWLINIVKRKAVKWR